jgi:Fuc2NAc and GlcNAc transferase
MTLWVLTILLAAVLSYFSSKKVTALAESAGMIALPGERQSHRVPTPTGGGLGLIFSVILSSLCLQLFHPIPGYWWLNMLPGILLLSVIGWFDDKQPVSTLVRLLVQLAVSLWLIGFGWSGLLLKDMALLAATVVAVVWMMNLYNFMDGSNGMAGFQGVFAGLVLALLFQFGDQHMMALLALAVAGACGGFLPLNFPHARVFMGDVASVPLGFIFAAFIVYGLQTGSLSLASSILVMAVFIVDATMTLLKRVFRGERWYTAHAQHVYQRLIAQGWTHHRVLLVYQIVNVIWVLPAIVLVEMYPEYAMVTVALCVLLLGICWYIANWRLGMIATEQIK